MSQKCKESLFVIFRAGKSDCCKIGQADKRTTQEARTCKCTCS